MKVRPWAAPPKRRNRLAKVAGGAAVLLASALAIALALPQLRWRVELLALDLSGRIPDIGVGDLIGMMMPGAGEHIGSLLYSRNPYAAIRVPPLSVAERKGGAELYAEHCATCHAPDGTGGAGAPALAGNRFVTGNTPWAVYRTIRYGIAGTGMPSHPLSSRQLWELVAYVRSLRAPTEATRLPAALVARLKSVAVPYSELAATAHPAADWLTYSGSYSSDRFSTLTQIDAQNVSQLALRWMYQFPSGPSTIECSPLVRNGIMYITDSAGRVIALGALTGRELWEHRHPFKLLGKEEGPIGQNRGVALLGNRVFAATWDSTLTALSAATGKVLWERRVGPYPGTWISPAPLAYRHLVVVGVSTEDGRGFLAAYDVRTGRLRWRFATIPGPGQPGHDTWAGDSWRKGGANPWMTGSYDPKRDILYWGTGNPMPDFSAATRKGDNLYTDSVIALRGTTGKLLWHFQFTPEGTHDWDSAQVPIIADADVGGELQRRLLWANRNGFYYVLNRLTGAFVRGVPFARENWASGLGPRGRPILTAVNREVAGHIVFPSANGATNWWPPSYDPDLGLTFVPALDQAMRFFPTSESLPTPTTETLQTSVRALDAYTGKLVWEHREPRRNSRARISGLLSTRGGLVFGGDDGKFFALDARSGRMLWNVGTGGTMYAAPVTFAYQGGQFVSLVAGRTLLTFALPPAARAAPADSVAGVKRDRARSHGNGNPSR